jgi:hypothetical protein
MITERTRAIVLELWTQNKDFMCDMEISLRLPWSQWALDFEELPAHPGELCHCRVDMEAGQHLVQIEDRFDLSDPSLLDKLNALLDKERERMRALGPDAETVEKHEGFDEWLDQLIEGERNQVRK